MKILIHNVLLAEFENGEEKQSRVDVFIADGRFEKIGPGGQDIEPGYRLIDGSDKAILPPFYNAHTHAGMTLLRGYADDMELFKWLSEYIWPFEAHLTPEDIYSATRLACLEMVRSGSIFFNDMYWHHREAIKAVDDFGMRACIGQVFLDAFDSEQGEEHKRKAETLLAERDQFSNRIIPSIAPHAIYTVSKPGLEWCRDFSAEHQIPLHIHISETQKEVSDSMEAHKLSPVQFLNKLGCLSERTIAAHLIHVDETDLNILADAGVTAVHNPGSNMKLCSGTFPFQKFHEKGIRIALGTDGCSSNNNLDMGEEVKLTALLAKHQSGDPALCTAGQALEIATRNGAEAFGLNAGVIAEGKLADCVLINMNSPEMAPGFHLHSDYVYSASQECIDTVICDGKILMENRTVSGQDEIVKEARATAFKLKEKAASAKS